MKNSWLHVYCKSVEKTINVYNMANSLNNQVLLNSCKKVKRLFYCLSEAPHLPYEVKQGIFISDNMIIFNLYFVKFCLFFLYDIIKTSGIIYHKKLFDNRSHKQQRLLGSARHPAAHTFLPSRELHTIIFNFIEAYKNITTGPKYTVL